MTINLTIDKKNIDNDFNRIASELMNNWILKVESKKYRIAEIEFYFKSDFHNDIYIHGHDLQKRKEKWYFHGSGVDITFGSNEFYGGILIRAIYDLTNQKYIYGPLNSVTEIFSNVKSVYESNLSFGLVPADKNKLEMEEPISAPRVGLNPDKDNEMFDSFYRFLIMPKQKHAEKTKIAEGMKQQEKYTEDDINEIWG
jgi:hypothetical protein